MYGTGECGVGKTLSRACRRAISLYGTGECGVGKTEKGGEPNVPVIVRHWGMRRR